jgi:hypothetical protein
MTIIRTIALSLLLATSGCISFDELGRHMPVVGKRCENWECFTSSGQSTSEERKAELRAEGKPVDEDDDTAIRRPINRQNVTGSMQAQQEQATAKPKEPTPFDMTPDQLQNLPLGGGR